MNTLNWIESEFSNGALSKNHAFVDFGMVDQKGRNIGCRAEIRFGEIDFSALIFSRKKFTVYAHATRDEKLFGGTSAGGIECETFDQAQAAAMDLAEKMRRRYVAKSKT
jgi:hypothetical protein